MNGTNNNDGTSLIDFPLTCELGENKMANSSIQTKND